MTTKQKEIQEAMESLREWIKPGDTIYTQIKSVSRSGMSRVIQLVQIKNNEPRWIGYTVAKAIGHSYDSKREGVKIGGCGMDMGFALVYELSHVLFGKGYKCLGKDKCRSSFHQGEHYNDYTSEPIHKDGYALNHRWL